MADHRAVGAECSKRRTPGEPPATGDHQCYFLCLADGLPMAILAPRSAAVEDRLHLFSQLATGWNLEPDSQYDAPAIANSSWPTGTAERGDPR